MFVFAGVRVRVRLHLCRLAAAECGRHSPRIKDAQMVRISSGNCQMRLWLRIKKFRVFWCTLTFAVYIVFIYRSFYVPMLRFG